MNPIDKLRQNGRSVYETRDHNGRPDFKLYMSPIPTTGNVRIGIRHGNVEMSMVVAHSDFIDMIRKVMLEIESA